MAKNGNANAAHFYVHSTLPVLLLSVSPYNWETSLIRLYSSLSNVRIKERVELQKITWKGLREKCLADLALPSGDWS